MSLFREGYEWKSVDTYVDAIYERSRLRKWGFSKKRIERALTGVQEHKDVLHPSAIKLSLGKGAAHDWSEANLWLADAIKQPDYEQRYFDDCTTCGAGPSWFHYANNSMPFEKPGSHVAPSYLDLDTFNLKEEVAWNDREIMLYLIDTRKTWPGLDLIWLFALNPEMFMQGWDRWRSYTTLYMPGIVLTDDENDDAARAWASTGWGFIPKFETGGPVVGFGHRSSSVGPGMCFVSYAE